MDSALVNRNPDVSYNDLYFVTPIKFNSQSSRAISSTGVPTDVSFVDLSIGWLSYTDGYVAKTLDGGRTWSDLIFAEDIWPAGYQPAYFAKIHFETVNHGWALGGDQLLYETKDGGKKWARRPKPKI